MAGKVVWRGDKLLANIQFGVATNLEKAADMIAESARQKAPVRKGSARSKREVKVTLQKGQPQPGSRQLNIGALSKGNPERILSLVKGGRLELEPHARGLTGAERFAVRRGRINRLRRTKQGQLVATIGGHLRDSIHVEEQEGSDNTHPTFWIGSNVEYAAAQELGWHHKPGNRFVKGQPYLRPALEEALPKLVDIVGGK